MRHHVEVPASEQWECLLDVMAMKFVACAGFDIE
jgi:hypothetical protein